MVSMIMRKDNYILKYIDDYDNNIVMLMMIMMIVIMMMVRMIFIDFEITFVFILRHLGSTGQQPQYVARCSIYGRVN